MSEYGEMLSPNTVRFERLLPGPIERVWSYIIDGDKRAQWLCGGDTEPRTGGKIELRFHNATISDLPDDPPPEKYATMNEVVLFNGTITRCEAPTVLAHTWEFEETASEVCYELFEAGEQVRLVITHSRLDTPEDVAGACGGWHTHLGILADILEGRERRPFWKTHTVLEAEYEQRLRG